MRMNESTFAIAQTPGRKLRVVLPHLSKFHRMNEVKGMRDHHHRTQTHQRDHQAKQDEISIFPEGALPYPITSGTQGETQSVEKYLPADPTHNGLLARPRLSLYHHLVGFVLLPVSLHCHGKTQNWQNQPQLLDPHSQRKQYQQRQKLSRRHLLQHPEPIVCLRRHPQRSR